MNMRGHRIISNRCVKIDFPHGVDPRWRETAKISNMIKAALSNNYYDSYNLSNAAR